MPEDGAMGTRERRIAVLAYDGIQSLDLVGPVEVFDVATRHRIDPPYRVEIVAPTTDPVVTSSGITITPAHALADLRGDVDTCEVAGGTGVEAALADPALVRQVARVASRSRRVASVCTGAFLRALRGGPAEYRQRFRAANEPALEAV
jgi:transcriptional regulator GlxA family with amidase domain